MREARSLLIGEGIRSETRREIRGLAQRLPGVTGVGDVRSMYVGRTEVLVTVQLSFSPGISAADMAASLARSSTRCDNAFR